MNNYSHLQCGIDACIQLDIYLDVILANSWMDKIGLNFGISFLFDLCVIEGWIDKNFKAYNSWLT